VFDINRLSVIVDDTLNKKMFIEKTYFALKQDDESAYRVLSESKEYRLEEEILELILLQPQPVYINNLKRMAREGCLLGRLVELKNHLLVPIIDKGQLLGLIATSAKVAGFRYTYEDITLLSVLANQVVVAINNSRLYAESLEKQRLEEELAVARQIQINLLPKSVPVHERYEFAAFNHPSRQVGGDYYDFIKTADGRICLVVADVSGKGIGAALLGARLQAVLQTEGRRGRPMEILLSGINDFLVESTSSDKFVTMFYGELDCNDNSLCFCNAGHNYPLLLRNDDKIEFLHEGGLILGALPGSQYAKAEVGFGQGDVLVIYTDGISEAFNENGEEFGEERLIETVRKARSKSAQFICGHIIKSVRQFAGHSTEVDDMTLIVLKAL
jgi:sigma-B regulation protein RsbU (phosphoserine phosphatase)